MSFSLKSSGASTEAPNAAPFKGVLLNINDAAGLIFSVQVRSHGPHPVTQVIRHTAMSKNPGTLRNLK
jgi:hypothetical protein